MVCLDRIFYTPSLKDTKIKGGGITDYYDSREQNTPMTGKYIEEKTW